MFCVWRYENHVSFKSVAFLAVACDLAVAFENVDFVFPIVAVQWRVSFRFDFKEAHGEIGCSFVFFDQPPYLYALSA